MLWQHLSKIYSEHLYMPHWYLSMRQSSRRDACYAYALVSFSKAHHRGRERLLRLCNNKSWPRHWNGDQAHSPVSNIKIRCVRCVRMRSGLFILGFYMFKIPLFPRCLFSPSSLSGTMRFSHPVDATDRWNTKVHLQLIHFYYTQPIASRNKPRSNYTFFSQTIHIALACMILNEISLVIK